MLARLDRRLVDVQIEFAGGGGLDGRLGDGAHEMVVAQPVGDEILDGADLQAVALREGDEVGHARHGAVVVHDLADDRRGVEPGETRQIDGRLGMTGADQHAALARDEREHVAGRDDVGRTLGGVDRGRDGARAVGGGDAGRDALARLDRLGEGGAVARAVATDHGFELELGRARAGQRQADEAAAIARHEVDGVGRRHLRGNDEVALVLALLGVDEHDHAAVAHVLQDLVDRGKTAAAFRDGVSASVVRHGRNSRSRAI